MKKKRTFNFSNGSLEWGSCVDDLNDVVEKWHIVNNLSWITYDTSLWLVNNMQGRFRCVGPFVYFEYEKDAILFKLTWS